MTPYVDIKKFLALEPWYYRYLKSISFHRDVSRHGASNYGMELILCRLDNFPIKELVLQAKGTFNIHVGEIDGMLNILLNIEDVRELQIEGARFRISEQENDLLSFYCESFSVYLR